MAVYTLPTAGAAQDHHGGGLPVSEKFEFPHGQRRVVIPFTNAGEHIMIPVSVNGSAPLEMVFDTGMPSPGVLLYRGTAADSIRLEYSPMPIRVGGAGGGASAEARLATGVSIEAGGLRVGGSIAIVVPPTPQMSVLHDGIIGATFLQNLVVTIDQDHHELVLEQHDGFTPPKGAAKVPLEFAGRNAIVSAGLVGRKGELTPLQLVLDLGATHAVSLNRSSSPAIVASPGAIATRVGRGMSGPMTGSVGRIAGLELGGFRLTNVVATFPDTTYENPRGMDSHNGNLGSGVLGRFNVTLDYAGKHMFVVKNQRFAEPFEWEMSGISYDIDELGRPVVAEVLPGSPAAEARVQPGDVLVSLDGKPANPRALMRDRDLYRVPGREVVLGMRRGREEKEFRVRLRRLV